MKLLIFIIAVLFASIALTLLAMENPGYVLIAREPWSIEMPLTLFGLLFIIAAHHRRRARLFLMERARTDVKYTA